MPTIIIDGESYQADGEKNLLEVCIENGLEIPYFCWHPSIGSVGSCRQCAVKQYQDKDDTRGRMVMSCMTPITDGMIVSLTDQDTQEFRDNCIESVMSNHPHDCPVCEKGSECHLQDMTNLSEHSVRYYDGKKRTFDNQYLGPFINHEMNRCITCYRCVRYYQDVAGGTDLQALGSRNRVYMGRDKDGILESAFSGNLVEVCPTGVFTDKTYSKHYARKWDMQTAPSICTHCSIGCNTSPGERYGELRRVVNRYNGKVNGYFICDRGRFGYDFVNSDKRIKNAFEKVNDNLMQAITLVDAIAKLKKMTHVRTKIGIGSPRASLESNFALLKLVGKNNFYAGVSHDEQQSNNLILEILSNAPAHISTLEQVKKADAVLVLGEDILNTAPMLALSVRESTKSKGKELATAARIPLWQAAAVKNIAQDVLSPFYNLTPAATDIDDIGKVCYRATPANLARIASAIANAIDPSAPEATDLSNDEKTLVQQIASDLTSAKRPLIISGSGCENTALLKATANIAKALYTHNKETLLSLVVREANSLGLTILVEDNPTADLDAAIKRGIEDENSALTVLILENDLSQRIEASNKDAFEKAIDKLIVFDQLQNDTAAKADLVIPAATFAESTGTLVSNEGRAQRYFAVFPEGGDSLASWSWLNQVTPNSKIKHFDELTSECAEHFPKLTGIVAAAPDASYRVAGQKVARQPHRYSGRGSMYSNITVDETQRAIDHHSALSFSMEGLQQNLPPALRPDVWIPAWNSSEAVNQLQTEVGGSLIGGDPGKRLFTQVNESTDWYPSSPEQDSNKSDTNKQDNLFQAIALYHIFGSDELSTQAPAIEERVPAPYVALNKTESDTLNVSEGDAVSVTLGDTKIILSVSINNSLPPGTVGIPRLREFNVGSLNRPVHVIKTSEKPLASKNKLFFKGN